jgi:hypothetical protein
MISKIYINNVEHYIPSDSAKSLMLGRIKSVKIGGNIYSLKQV